MRSITSLTRSDRSTTLPITGTPEEIAAVVRSQEESLAAIVLRLNDVSPAVLYSAIKELAEEIKYLHPGSARDSGEKIFNDWVGFLPVAEQPAAKNVAAQRFFGY